MPQTPLTDQTLVGVTNAGAQFAPAAAALSGGGYVIVWQDSSTGRVFAQRFSATGQPVGNELPLDSTQGGSPIWVSVAATANDGFVIAFQAGGFAQAEIYGRWYDGLNNPVGGLFAVNSTSPNEQFNPHITTLEGGGLLFTWDTQAFDVFQEVRGRVFLPNGPALGADFVVAPMSATDQHGLSAIAPLPGGGFVVTWQRAANSGTNFEIVGQRFTSSGEPAGAEFQANTQTANSQYGNDVARLSDGGFVVSWIDPLPSNGGGRVVARHFDAGGNPIGGEIFVDGKASGAYGRTVVTALADGGYVVGWIRDDSADDNVLARAFDSHDQPQGPAFEMSYNSPFNSNFFSDGAVTLANGHVVFTWDGPSTNTSEDVYFRMYEFTPDGGNSPAIARPDALATDEATFVTGNVFNDNGSGTDTDVDGPTLSVSAVNGSGANVGTQITLASGARLTLNASGTFSYDPNHAFDATPAAASGASNTPAHDSFTYTLAGGGTATVSLTINGLDSNDMLVGTVGIDTLSGGAGDDRYFVDQDGDLALESSGHGNDRVLTGVSYVLATGSEIERLTTIDNFATTPINLTGNELGQYLFGNAGDNVLDGSAGADVMAGLGGDDRYYVDTAADRVIEAAGEGYDRILSAVSWSLEPGSYVDKVTMIDNLATTALNLTGNDLSQYVYGNAGANILDGGGGGDVMVGLEGDDNYYIRNVADRIVEAVGSGNDRVFAAANFTLEAGSEVEKLTTVDNLATTAINLTGNELAQTLFGNAGNNVLDGKLGNDILYGLGGSDTFQFTAAPSAGNVDTIGDFTSGTDRIALDDAAFTAIGGLGALNPNAFFAGTAAHDADDRIIYDGATGTLLYDADGDGAGAAVLFATLQSHPVVAAGDFTVI